MALTERRIRDMKPGPKTVFVWDNRVSGKGRLGVRITPAGAKAFVLDYFDAGGTRRRMTLGRPGEMPLASARETASRELAAVRDGKPDMAERQQQRRAAPTVARLVEDFLTVEGPARIARGRMTENTLHQYRHGAGKYLLPALGEMRVEDVKRADIERMAASLPGTTRNRALALASRLFTLAEIWEWRTPGSNPVRKVERAREEARDRVLSGSEMAALAAALADMESRKRMQVAAIRFLAVTGLRVGEALAIAWDHVDAETGRLLIPESKTGRKWHDLPTPAVEILAALPRLGPWAFTTTGRVPLRYRAVQVAFRDACHAAGIGDARLHDLRRGVISAAAASGANVAVLQRLLGHKTVAMAMRYATELRDPVQATREHVATQMAAAMTGKPGEVIPLHRQNTGTK